MRYLSIDLGDKRTGIALGDDETNLVSPIDVITASRPRNTHDLDSSALMNSLMKFIEAQKPHALIIGLPLNMDGTEGPAAKTAREFGERLATRSNLPVHYQDERLTSYAADQSMAQSGRTHKQKKELRDALAAAEILRDFIDGRSRTT